MSTFLFVHETRVLYLKVRVQ